MNTNIHGDNLINPEMVRSGVTSSLSRIKNFGNFNHGEWNNPYAEHQSRMVDRVANRPDFSWSKQEDPLWDTYKKSYLREGDRAQRNVMAQAAAMTGGRPSSFAMSAAGQAGDHYASRLNDMIPQLYRQAYDRHVQDHQLNLADLAAMNAQADQNRGWFESDRSHAFDVYRNAYMQLLQKFGVFHNQDQANKGWLQQDWENQFRWLQHEAAQAAASSSGGGSGGGSRAPGSQFDLDAMFRQSPSPSGGSGGINSFPTVQTR